ncbi:MAG: hypothetical protein QNK75_02570 [Crocinitomicaceae bacterium]
MELSPFIHGFTVSELSFTNGEEEVKKLKSNLLQGINSTLILPHCWGKSSLVEKVIDEVNTKENRDMLLLNDYIDKSVKDFEMLDPAFELWFKRQFFKIPIHE